MSVKKLVTPLTLKFRLKSPQLLQNKVTLQANPSTLVVLIIRFYVLREFTVH